MKYFEETEKIKNVEKKGEGTLIASAALGDTLIPIEVKQMPGNEICYICLHDDEYTAYEAAQEMLRQAGGYLLSVKTGGKRLVSFTLNNEEYTFDPNRIFTDRGRRLTLNGPPERIADAREAAADFANLLTGAVASTQKHVVALHNNEDARYSVDSYIRDGQLEKNAAMCYLSDKEKPFNFFYVTTREVFNYLMENDVNVVLQHNQEVEDDGSLSVYCAQKEIPYVNLEVKKGQKQEQVRMLMLLNQYFNK